MVKELVQGKRKGEMRRKMKEEEIIVDMSQIKELEEVKSIEDALETNIRKHNKVVETLIKNGNLAFFKKDKEILEKLEIKMLSKKGKL